MHLDPIEKKPLYHFMPGSMIFSVGFFGCTLKCQFCQNHTISQIDKNMEEIINKNKKWTPQGMINYLKKNEYSSIAFTYSEPTLYYEWVLETARLCKENNIKTVLVTNGYLNPNPASKLLQYIDAANIDLKSAKESFYRKSCFGHIEPVKEFIKIAFEKGVHIEVTTLVITDTNSDIEECVEITEFLSSISKDIPYHISRYFPNYKFDLPPTDKNIIYQWIDEAKKRLNFVYGGNI
ncbi:MAG TPA: radical SAM protein [Spirochaetota bacterium]|nr:radical SAM protein [Spirochaetota bacterium]